MAGIYGWNVETSQDLIASEAEITHMPEPIVINSESESEEETSSENPSSNPCIKGYYWCVSGGDVPSQAIRAGVDSDGGDIYIGRAIHEGGIQPAKVLPSQGCAYISYNGEEIRKDEYEILCRGTCTVIWQECQDGMVPYNAVAGGCTSDNEKLYIGRVFHEGTQTPGKIHPSHNTCYIPYGGEELSFSNYEALVLQ